MVSNIFIKSAFVVVSIFVIAGAIHSLNTKREIRHIQENYEIISKLKEDYAKKYNIKDTSTITRDDLIASLPNGSWEKAFLLDRDSSSNLSNKNFIDENANIKIDQSERLKIMALRAKISKEQFILENGEYKIQIAPHSKNFYNEQKEWKDSVNSATNYLFAILLPNILDTNKKIDDVSNINIIKDFKESKVESFIPDYNNVIEDEKKDLKDRFIYSIKESLNSSTIGYEARVHQVLKDNL
ncbi:hypothetical protein [Aliarcobacter skirrowii]|uniref:hypothetical protein n=1 Tax=Aliarcobacter skirrowii TaxID=28200 RepID=UPI0029BED04B|nr:hypothetical protein [Aliarcobacter skirrowii]MDX4036363.1 hypothetical protein [Aliarcobacter skirrowii]